MVIQEVALVYEVCYDPVWTATQQALYQHEQVGSRNL